MAKEGIGSRVSDVVIKQLEKRQEIVAKDGENSRKAYLVQSNTPWIKLRSSVNQINDGVDLDNLLIEIDKRLGIPTNSKVAENFQLAGGTLEAGQLEARAGVNRTQNEINTKFAYSNFNGEYGLGYRPMPGITDANIKSKGTFGTLSEANVSFKVYSVEDLELCELLYFRPGYTALLEWGHSVFVDKNGNILKTGLDTITIPDESYFSKQSFETIVQQITNVREAHEGNYDALFGFITNFSFEIEKDGSYNCTVKIVSSGAILEGLKPTMTSDKTSEEDEDKEEENRKYKSIYHYIFHYLRDGKKEGQFNGKEHLIDKKQSQVASYLDDFEVFSQKTDIQGHFLGDQFDKRFPLQYIRLGDFLMMVNKLNSWRDPKKNPEKDDPEFILFDLSFGNEFLTFEDHISCDPIVAFPPKLPTGASGDRNGQAAPTNIFQRIGLTDVRDAGEVYKKSIHDDLSPLMQKHARSNDGGLTDILNIFVSTYCIEKSINDVTSGVQDDTVGMYNVIKDVLSNVQAAFCEVNNFDLYYNYTSQKFQVVDRQYTLPGDLPVINMTGLSSVVSNINISSTISSAIASQVAIAAQGNSGNTKDNLGAMMEWNRGAIDRHLEMKGTDDQDEAEDRQIAQGKYLKKLYNFFYKWNDRAGVFSDQDYIAEDIESLRSELNADMQKLLTVDRVANKKSVQGVVPVELSFDIDGIQGFLIGTTFKINRGLLPSKYDNWAYIVTGVEHKVSKNRWITSIKTQFYPDRGASPEAADNYKNQSRARAGSNPPLVDSSEDVGVDTLLTPNANDLRATLETLGYEEKGRELSSGGDITGDTLKMGRAVARMIKQKLPNLEVRFSAGNDLYHQKLKSSLSRHKKGRGLDFTITPSSPRDVKRVEKILKGFAAGEHPYFRYINEYDNATKFATGKHFHISWGTGSEAQKTIDNALAEANRGKISKYKV